MFLEMRLKIVLAYNSIIALILLLSCYLTFKIPTILADKRYLINAYTLKDMGYLSYIAIVIISLTFLFNLILLNKNKRILFTIMFLAIDILIVVVFYSVFYSIFS